MEIDSESIDYMDEHPTVLMLREEGTYWEPPTIVEATTKLNDWAWEGAAHPMEDSMKKIKIVKLVTLAKKIKTVEPITPAKNIASVAIESIFASISILVKSICDSFSVESDLVKSVCDSFPVKSVESVESVKKSFAFNMIFYSAYLLALNVFISKIGKETLNDKELKHGYLEPIKEET